MKSLLVLTCVVALTLAQGPTMPPREVRTTRMGPTGTLVRPTLLPTRPTDGTTRDCDLTSEEREENMNCPCRVVMDEEGCPECPDSCMTTCPPRPLCELICADGFATDSNGCEQCRCRQREMGDRDDDAAETVEEARRRLRCHPNCIVTRQDTYVCNRTCNSTQVHRDNYDECDLDTMPCEADERCAITGEGNVRECVGRPGQNERCSNYDPRDDGVFRDDERLDEDEEEEEEEQRRRPSNEGSDDRFVASFLMESVGECGTGLTCNRDNNMCELTNGPCTMAVGRREATIDQCDDDGMFNARRCSARQGDGPRLTCLCVRPDNGMQIPDTMQDVNDMRDFDASDCIRRAYRNCTVMRGSRSFQVFHGDRVFTMPQAGRCRVCRCNDGMADECETRDCQADMDGDREESACTACESMPRDPVCGPDGRNYPTKCHAMRCGGFEADEITDRPCASVDVCSLFPCRDGFTCVRTAGVSCMGRCKPNELRSCVDRKTLRCPANQTVDGGDVVCGSNGQSYRSFCHMIKLGSPDVRVRHRGRCDDPSCANAPMMCGTDRVTYANSCEMRTLSANARGDHTGQCEMDEQRAMTDDQLCQKTRENNRCGNMDCMNRVQPKEGCCPVCGGITTITMMRDELTTRKSASDERLDTDDIMSRIREADLIPDEVFDRCRVHSAITTKSNRTNMEVSFHTDRNEDSSFCQKASVDLANTMNSEVVTLPDVASYASVTVAEPLIQDSGSGAPGLTGSVVAMVMAALFSLSVFVF